MKFEADELGAIAGVQATHERVPAGFVLRRSEAFIDRVGPIYQRTHGDGRVDVGFVAQAHHANLFGAVHGGMFATLADVALGINVLAQSEPGTRLGTVSLNVDFIAGGRVDEWIEASVTLDKMAGRLRFASCLVRGEDGRSLLRASGVFSSYVPRTE